MHVFEHGGFRIMHDDYSGKAHVIDERANPYKTLDVPCEVMFAFTAEYVRAEKISRLLKAEGGELLLGIKEAP